ncbi:hypothetical protein MBLNU459_g4849t1 [Dothideomycetes sp. NU459]
MKVDRDDAYRSISGFSSGSDTRANERWINGQVLWLNIDKDRDSAEQYNRFHSRYERQVWDENGITSDSVGYASIFTQSRL